MLKAESRVAKRPVPPWFGVGHEPNLKCVSMPAQVSIQTPELEQAVRRRNVGQADNPALYHGPKSYHGSIRRSRRPAHRVQTEFSKCEMPVPIGEPDGKLMRL